MKKNKKIKFNSMIDKNKINLNDEQISVMKNIIKFNEFKFDYIKDYFRVEDYILLSILPILTLVLLIGKEFLGGIFLIPFVLSVFFIIGSIYENKVNKKSNIEAEKEYNNTLELLFNNINKNHLTIVSLKEVIKELEKNELIYIKIIDKEYFIYESDITIKQFNDFLINKIHKNEKKKEKFLNEI